MLLTALLLAAQSEALRPPAPFLLASACPATNLPCDRFKPKPAQVLGCGRERRLFLPYDSMADGNQHVPVSVQMTDLA